jgi:hypothetical protein
MKPKEPKISGLDLVLQALQDAEGWSFLTTTQAFPGSITSGGRLLFVGPDNRRCTVGKRTTCFFEMVNKEATNFRNYSTAKDIEKIQAELK